MQLTDSVHLVGSGRLGWSITHPLDCHVYLIASENDAVLIDAGCGSDPDLILYNLDYAGVPRSSVSRILLTHAHADHAGGAAPLAAVLQAEVFGSSLVAKTVSAGDEQASGLALARAAGTYPADYHPQTIDVTSIREGDLGSVGAIQLRALETPGHAAGHLSYVASAGGRRLLFSGDLVFARGRVVLLNSPDSDPEVLGASIRLVAKLGPDSMFPGHGEVVMTDAASHLGSAIAHLDRGQIPEPFLP